MATVQAERSAAQAGQAGLKANAIGILDALVIGLASAAPGTHAKRPLKGAILGSTPHKLLHLSDRPVVVVPIGGGAPNGG